MRAARKRGVSHYIVAKAGAEVREDLIALADEQTPLLQKLGDFLAGSRMLFVQLKAEAYDDTDEPHYRVDEVVNLPGACEKEVVIPAGWRVAHVAHIGQKLLAFIAIGAEDEGGFVPLRLMEPLSVRLPGGCRVLVTRDGRVEGEERKKHGQGNA